MAAYVYAVGSMQALSFNLVSVSLLTNLICISYDVFGSLATKCSVLHFPPRTDVSVTHSLLPILQKPMLRYSCTNFV